MKYQLKTFNRNITDQELLYDLKNIAKKLKATKLSSRNYDNNGGKYTSGTISIRFGSWNNALKEAGLDFVLQREVAERELFKNMEEVWANIGGQPVFRDMKSSISKYSTNHYITKFGTWRKALVAFIEYINSDNDSDEDKNQIEENVSEVVRKSEILFKHQTKRIPNERLKVQVLMRDGNKCRLCGIVLIGKDIHFDHIIPWSKGGETILENLQILCSLHNLAKGNLDYTTIQDNIVNNVE